MTEHTPGPWVQFAIDGKCDAIMPACREGDICTFRQPPSDADARLMTLAPMLLRALTDILEANKDFRDGMPQSWDGDPLQDACDAAQNILAWLGNAKDPGSQITSTERGST